MLKKNISDGVGSRNESIDTPLDPPLFWLDNIFKLFPVGESLVSDIPAGNGKIDNLFYSVHAQIRNPGAFA